MSASRPQPGIGTRLAQIGSCAALLALVAACGGQAATTAPVRAVSAPSVPSPTGLSVTVTGTSALVSWTASSGTLTGYKLYVDQNPPIAIGANATSRQLSGLATDANHFVAVVAVAGKNVSNPADTTFKVAPATYTRAPEAALPASASAAAETGASRQSGASQVAAPPNISLGQPTQAANPPQISTPNITVHGKVTGPVLMGIDPVVDGNCAGEGAVISVVGGDGSVLGASKLEGGTHISSDTCVFNFQFQIKQSVTYQFEADLLSQFELTGNITEIYPDITDAQSLLILPRL